MVFVCLKLWDLLEGKKLFKAVESHDAHEYDDQTHLALITALLGDPPRQLTDSGRRTPIFCQPNGTWAARTRLSSAYGANSFS
jgi:serine/threonine-protein kinase SRPK3